MSNIPILNLPVAVSLDGSEYAPVVQGNVTRRVTTGLISRIGIAAAIPASMQWVIDAQGASIPAANWGTLTVPFNATISSVTMEANQSGSVIVDIWKCTYGEYDPPTVPTVAYTITGSTPPTISGASKSVDTALVNWDTDLAEGDILTFVVPSTATNISRVTLSLNLVRVVS